jgi:hypothetical protein
MSAWTTLNLGLEPWSCLVLHATVLADCSAGQSAESRKNAGRIPQKPKEMDNLELDRSTIDVVSPYTSLVPKTE